MVKVTYGGHSSSQLVWVWQSGLRWVGVTIGVGCGQVDLKCMW